MKLTNDEWGVLRQALYRQVSESYLDNATDKMKKMGTIAENLIERFRVEILTERQRSL